MRENVLNKIGDVPVYIDRTHPVEGRVYYWSTGAKLPFMMPHMKPLKLKHNGEWYEYEPIYAGFDIETTNFDRGDDHLAFMYHWHMCIASTGSAVVIMGRTWSEFLDLIQALKVEYNLSPERRIIIWIANFGFEFQFIRRYFDWDEEDFFAREERHPMKARTCGFEFHEALTISGGSLGQLAKDYTVTQKLAGDLDYSILRNSKTPLTDAERNYCINDVVILAEWARYIHITYIAPDKRIPLTKTGILRCDTRQELLAMKGPAGVKQYRSLIYECFPRSSVYDIWFKYLFRGGYVHSNCLMTGFTIPDPDGYDITSSYPTEMLLRDGYPLAPFHVEPYDPELLEKKCCIMTVAFTNIKRRFAHSIESKSKCMMLEGSAHMPIVIDNGRVAQAAYMRVMLTEIDLKIYKRYYTWDDMQILTFETAEKGFLPLFIRKTLAKYYKLKAELKKFGLQDTPEYVIAKQKVNSFFGMMVTRIELDKVTYDNLLDQWIVAEKALDFGEEIKSQFLLPQWGIYVTAFARYALLSVTADITEAIGDGSGDNGAGVIYNDTDSIKVYDPTGEAAKIIDAYNERIRQRRIECKITNPAFDGLGEFEHEAHYDMFKTLGAKRYLTSENGKVKATIAGLPKQSILNIDGDPFEEFNLDGMTLDADVSLKKTISYNDDHTEAIIDGELMQEESSAGIYDISFTMNLEKAYYTIVTEGLTERVRKYGD